jgi:effector-binding domain-containing protein
MFKIGDFSRLSKVSVKALRYYDQLGLLKPVEVDRWTGYRYYSAGQLPRLYRILVFKDLGFSLEQVASLLGDELPTSQIRGMLRLKQAEIQQQVAEEQERLERIEARLQQIEKENTNMPEYEVVLKKVPPMTIASLRETVPTYPDVGRLHGEMDAYFRQQGVEESDTCFTIWHDPEYREKDVDAEVAFPIVPGSLKGNERITIRELPGLETAASVVHQGPYETVGPAYDALTAWIEANGYRITGPDREIYLNNSTHTKNPAEFVTEIQYPVEKV